MSNKLDEEEGKDTTIDSKNDEHGKGQICSSTFRGTRSKDNNRTHATHQGEQQSELPEGLGCLSLFLHIY